MEHEKECPVCRSLAYYQTDLDKDSVFYVCPVCGRYQLTLDGYYLQDDNRLAPYLYFNRFQTKRITEYRYHTTLSGEQCDSFKQSFNEGNNTNGYPVHMDVDIIESWYPRTFSEKVDQILLQIDSIARHVGQEVSVNNQEMLSLLFVDRKERDERQISETRGKILWRDYPDCFREADYMLDYLKDSGYIKDDLLLRSKDGARMTLTPKGYARVEELQKASSFGRSALVAMQFGEATKALREAIRKGISDAGYHAVFIDEVQHNDFITPELLKHIRDSKFVVVDLTHQNNGAYFEEGYAMGIGKPVIQLCQRETKLHFDVAQKNTIMWSSEDDIPERLVNRIKATID